MKIYKINPDSDFDLLCNNIKPQITGQKIMQKKAKLNFFYIKNIKRVATNILKQDALSIGAELVSSKESIFGGDKLENALLIATDKQIELLAKKEILQDFGLKELSNFLKIKFKKPKTPKIMGVLNFNHDSFNPNSRTKLKDCIKKCEQMLHDGADFLDIGAVSSRPGSEYIGSKAEFERIKPVIDELYKHKIHEKTKLSLDSFDENCLKYALDHGFCFVNDISGNTALCELSKQYDAWYCLMNMIGEPKTMQKDVKDCDILNVVDDFFEEKLSQIKDYKKIILDVGIGFGKTANDNMKLIKNLEHFLHFGFDLLVGASRKSVINAYFPSNVEDRLAGSLYLHQKAYENGAKIIRTHDVYEHAQMFKLASTYEKITI